MATLTLKSYAHPEGTFAARIIDVMEDESRHGPVYKVRLRTDEGDCQALVSAKYSPKSKLARLVRCALGNVPEEINTDDLIGAQLRITVEHRDIEGVAFDRVT